MIANDSTKVNSIECDFEQYPNGYCNDRQNSHIKHEIHHIKSSCVICYSFSIANGIGDVNFWLELYPIGLQ